MKKVYIGLAPGFTSYWDPKTRTRLSIQESHKNVFYREVEDLDNITDAVLASTPVLIAYGGLPKEAIERWEEKYQKVFKTKSPRYMRNIFGDIVESPKYKALDRSEKFLSEMEDLLPKEDNPKPKPDPEPETKPEEVPEKDGEDEVVAAKSTPKKQTKTTPSKKQTTAKKDDPEKEVDKEEDTSKKE